MYIFVCVCSVTQSCLTLCNPMNYSQSGSSAHGIFQARILKSVAISSPKGSSQPRDQTASPASPALAGGFFTPETWEVLIYIYICILYSMRFYNVLYNTHIIFVSFILYIIMYCILVCVSCICIYYIYTTICNIITVCVIIRGREELDTTERLHFHFSLSCIGGRNGNPLQYSCLENPMDVGTW